MWFLALKAKSVTIIFVILFNSKINLIKIYLKVQKCKKSDNQLRIQIKFLPLLKKFIFE